MRQRRGSAPASQPHQAKARGGMLPSTQSCTESAHTRTNRARGTVRRASRLRAGLGLTRGLTRRLHEGGRGRAAAQSGEQTRTGQTRQPKYESARARTGPTRPRCARTLGGCEWSASRAASGRLREDQRKRPAPFAWPHLQRVHLRPTARHRGKRARKACRSASCRFAGLRKRGGQCRTFVRLTIPSLANETACACSAT